MWQQKAEAAYDCDEIGPLGVTRPTVPDLQLFPLPWRTDREAEAMHDRSEEIEQMVRACARLSRRLSEIDGALSAAPATGYR